MAEFKVNDIETSGEDRKRRFKLPLSYLAGMGLGAVALLSLFLFSSKEEVIIQSGGDIVEEQFKRFEESYKQTNEALIEEIRSVKKELGSLKRELQTIKEKTREKEVEKQSLPSFPQMPVSGQKSGQGQGLPPFQPSPEPSSPEAGWKEVSFKAKSLPSLRVRYFAGGGSYRSERKTIYLPVGSVLKVRSIGTITAPTVITQKGPGLPVALFRVDDVVLPNRRKAPLKDCFVIGKAYGNWNRQRVDVQAVALSCTTPEGYMEAQINGWVKGEDEDDGLVGEVEYARGREIAFYFGSVFLRGFASGMAQAQTAQQTQTSPSGTTQTTIVKNAFSYSMWKSLEESIRAVTDFYLQNADQMFPVVKARPQTGYIILVNTAAMKEVQPGEG